MAGDEVRALPDALVDAWRKVRALEKQVADAREAVKVAKEALDEEMAYVGRLIDECTIPTLFTTPSMGGEAHGPRIAAEE